MEQATLVRQTVKESGVSALREGGSVASAQATAHDLGVAVMHAGGLDEEDLRMLAEIATGVTTDVAARRLELSARTLRRRLRAVCDRLGVNTPIEAVVWAARRHLI
ncbi:hypothetical protein [Actinorugispora endophytica]|uniref:Regulatory LuxR family protein n=1 Tax=Actinorugispora endophytica TaxID=1605990 RepID=A0A4R6V7X2_9ACTN|nr:hypothetical protein [Actinorugispora endophytica]TDQ55209.1 regulatory LuxR family protein [Actinorugispora endophytica]